MATPRKRVLHAGLAGPPNEEYKKGGMTQESVQAEVDKGAQKARDAGYEVQLTFFEPEDFDVALSTIKKELETGKWDALVVGGGIRVAPELTPQFEQLVNTSREVAPKTKILFQGRPDDIHESVKRGFE